MILACAHCAKTIDARPPACPSCGAAGPDADVEARRSWTALAAAFLLAAGMGVYLSFQASVARVYAQVQRGPAPRPEDLAMRRTIRELVPRLKADQTRPLVDLEDLVLAPGAHAGRRVSVLAYLFSVKTPGAVSGRLSFGWGHGAMVEIDLSRLSEEDRTELAALSARPHFVVLRGRVGTKGPETALEPLLLVERHEVVPGETGVLTVATALAD